MCCKYIDGFPFLVLIEKFPLSKFVKSRFDNAGDFSKGTANVCWTGIGAPESCERPGKVEESATTDISQIERT